jgi:hypothetical protein
MPVSYSGGNRQERIITESRLLAVEGADDQYLIGVIANELQLTLQIHQMQGRRNGARRFNSSQGPKDSIKYRDSDWCVMPIQTPMPRLPASRKR